MHVLNNFRKFPHLHCDEFFLQRLALWVRPLFPNTEEQGAGSALFSIPLNEVLYS